MKNKPIQEILTKKYSLGFSEDFGNDTIPIGLNEDVVRVISQKKNEPEWLLEWRLQAFRHWQTLIRPEWARVQYPEIDFQAISYYSSPKKIDANKEIDPDLMAYYEKLGVPLKERDILSGRIAIDAVMDSVSIGTTFKESLEKVGVIFCSFSEAVKNHPELVKQYLGTVVSYRDNFYAALNSAVFSDGSFCFIPKGVKCPMELSTYFRINQANTGQFERTLIIAEDDSYVSYLEGCFIKGTQVYTPDEGFKSIEYLTHHDFVLDHQGNKQRILNRQEKNVVNKAIYNFYLKHIEFTCTEEHPIYVYSKGVLQFKKAKDIKLDDKLCIHKDIYLKIKDTFSNDYFLNKDPSNNYFLFPILNILESKFTGTVYNLEIENSNTYNVFGLAVHNCSAPSRDENQLHAAIVELIALENATIKYATVQNWFPGDENGKGGVYNFVTKRGECRGKSSHISWTQIETGSAITWKYPSVILRGDYSTGEFYSVALTNHYQQADTGTKMIHLGKETKSTIIAKSISAGNSVGTYRGLVRIASKAHKSRNFTQCDSLIFGKAQVYTEPYIESSNSSSILEHEATTSKMSDEHLFYLQQHGLTEEQAKNMLVNGFCKSVFQKLPAEFAVEAQKLLEINLEGSMG